MHTPNERIEQLKNLYSLIAAQQYVSAIRQSGKVMELGMKDCIHRIAQADNDAVLAALSRFNENRTHPLLPSNMGFGSLVRLYYIGKLWDALRIQLHSNLFYTQMIPWRRLVKMRNQATHQKLSFTREQALEMFHFTKVFMYDCELIPGGNSRIPDIPDLPMQKCHQCNVDVAPEWNFCPSCGHRAVQNCNECNRALSPEWNICPYCNTSRNKAMNVIESKALYKIYCEGIWADLIVTPHERAFLETKRLYFGLDPHAARIIEEEVIPSNYIRFKELLEAVLLDDLIEDYELEFLMDKANELQIDEEIAKQIVATYAKHELPQIEK